jgi:RNA 2',3'-cyclic 3'-phosphodiesterase
MHRHNKRLFFGAEASAPWPHDFPKGRVLQESSRHMTLAFLGEVCFPDLQQILTSFPTPPFKVGLVGKSDRLLFLPETKPHVVAYHVHWLEYDQTLRLFQKNLTSWLAEHHFKVLEKQDFLSHVTIARSPFDVDEWSHTYQDIPFLLHAIHLYESVGLLNYQPLWSYPLIPPFEEIEHTADLAFRIRAETNLSLHLHAQIALAFKFPSLLPFLFLDSLKDNLDDMIIALNKIVTHADREIGSPIKAVSFHGSIHINAQNIREWEMIIDV